MTEGINLHTPAPIFTIENIVMWFMAMIISNRNYFCLIMQFSKLVPGRKGGGATN